jgi:hypothetical protein
MAKAKTTKSSDAKTSSSKNGRPAKRAGIRFQPDPNTTAAIDFGSVNKGASFQPTMAALVTEESYRGCGIVVPTTKALQVGDHLRIKVGDGPVLAAEVRWRTELDAQVMRLGVMFLD